MKVRKNSRKKIWKTEFDAILINFERFKVV